MRVSEQSLERDIPYPTDSRQGAEIGVGIGAGRESARIAQIVHINVTFPRAPLRKGRGVERNVRGIGNWARHGLLCLADIASAEGGAPNRPNWFSGSLDFSANRANWDINADMTNSPLWNYVG